jgi:hypothetical protein
MEKTTAMRARLIGQVSHMLLRPGMYSSHDQSFEIMCQMRLGDLRFIDGLPEPTRDEHGLSRKYWTCGAQGLGGFPEDPLLRGIRLPGSDFAKSLRLTRHGEALQNRADMERLA